MRISISLLLLILSSTVVQAGSLQVAPVTVDVQAPSASSSITLKNTGDRPVAMQARIFAWSQSVSGDDLAATRTVVVSPPIVKVGVGKQAVVRIVRVSKAPVTGEEAYRLLVDELPDRAATRGAQIRMVMRYSIPVFFTSRSPQAPKLDLSVAQQAGKLLVTATNHGYGHVKLSALEVSDRSGQTHPVGKGLVGYVLGGSTRTFSSTLQGSLTGPEVTIAARTNLGPLKTEVSLERQ